MDFLFGNTHREFQLIPSLGPFAAPTGLWGTGLAILQVLLVATAGVNEVQNPTQYSKFANPQTATLPSKYGMLILYAPSAILAAVLTATATMDVTTSSSSSSTTLTLASICVALHFGKRVLEALFLHKYSGTMDLGTSIGIGSYYALASALIIGTATPMDLEQPPAQRIGLVVFFLGEIGNLYHHYLLRQLRSDKSKNSSSSSSSSSSQKQSKRYIPPQGGLFRLVAAPHYLCEIVAFLGIALTAQSLHALLVALGMGSYLAGRAVLTHQFYAKTFDKLEWSPRETKALIPFLF